MIILYIYLQLIWHDSHGFKAFLQLPSFQCLLGRSIGPDAWAVSVCCVVCSNCQSTAGCTGCDAEHLGCRETSRPDWSKDNTASELQFKTGSTKAHLGIPCPFAWWFRIFWKPVIWVSHMSCLFWPLVLVWKGVSIATCVEVLAVSSSGGLMLFFWSTFSIILSYLNFQLFPRWSQALYMELGCLKAWSVLQITAWSKRPVGHVGRISDSFVAYCSWTLESSHLRHLRFFQAVFMYSA